MHFLSYLLSAIVFIATHVKLSDVVPSWNKGHVTVQPLQVTRLAAKIATESNARFQPRSNTATEQDSPPDSLDAILKKDTHSEGMIQNILGGLALCYNVLANLLLYPIFSFLLLILSVGIVILGGFWVKKIKNEQSVSTSWILFTCLYILVYLDLFLVVYQKKEVLILFLELEKDLFLTVVSAFMGYIVGKFFSSKFFEEKELP